MLNGATTYKGSKSGKPGLPDNEADVGGFESYPSETRDASWVAESDAVEGKTRQYVRPYP